MFWDKLFLNKENNLSLLKFLNLLRYLGPLEKEFFSWCSDIPYKYMKMQVSQLMRVLEEEFSKTVPGAVQPSLLHIVHLNIKNICEFLKMLWKSNSQQKRISSHKFICENVEKYFEPAFVFQQYLSKKEELNFINYPFLLNLNFKYKLLQYESFYEQKVSMHRNLTNGLQNLLNGNLIFDVNGNFSVESLAFLNFEIHRDNILEESIEKLGMIDTNLKNPLKIKFIGEEGRDEGGVQN